MASLFSRIIAGEIPCFKVAENDDFFAFLDINPLAKGHSLVVLKKEVDYIFDVDDELLSRMLPFAKELGLKIEKVVPCERIGLAVIGLEVPHCHIHLIPINGIHDIDFSRPKLQFSEAEMAEIAEAIRTA